MYFDNSQLRIGDRLIRKKGGFLSRHHALYAGLDYYTNKPIVAENQTGVGVRYITLEKFLRDGELVKVEYNYFSSYQQEIILEKINRRLGRSYDLFFYNCEHFVNDVLNSKTSSKQIRNGVGLGIGLLALTLLSK